MKQFLFVCLVAPIFDKQVFEVFESGRKYGMTVKSLYDELNAVMPDSLIGDAMKTKGCSALQMSDQMVCNKCGLRWDMNDPDPPTCRTLPANAVIEVGSSDKSKNRFYHAFKNNLMLMKQQQEKRK